MISTGLAIALVTSGALVFLAVVHAINPLSAMPFLMLNTFSIGLVTPNVVHGTMEPVPEIAGVASSLFGSARMLAGAISTELVAFWYTGTPLAMTGAMLLFATAAFTYWLFTQRTLQEAHQAAPRRCAENSFASH
jgi:DHA1 family bicyclomycin/chloramphenicol resistance-like MFS transporter